MPPTRFLGGGGVNNWGKFLEMIQLYVEKKTKTKAWEPMKEGEVTRVGHYIDPSPKNDDLGRNLPCFIFTIVRYG